MTISEVTTLARIATLEGVDKIKLTGGEPLLYKSPDGDIIAMVQSITALRSTGAQFDLSMTTNGTMLPELAHPLAAAGLDRVTVSLTTMDWRTFSEFVSPNALLLKRTVAGVTEAQFAGLSPTKINLPIYYSAQRGLGNLYELPNIMSFAAEQKVAEVRVFTLLSHDTFAEFQEYYHFFSPEMQKSIARCLREFGVDSIPETVSTLTRLGRSFSAYAYPKIEFGVDLDPTTLAFEPMRYSRLGESTSDQEGPYAVRVGADGGRRTVLGAQPDYCLIDAIRSSSSDEELRKIYRATQEEMP
jgi:hypothetical protein